MRGRVYLGNAIGNVREVSRGAAGRELILTPAFSTTAFAVQGVADIAEAFRLHTPATARKHQLLIVWAQLNVALGQTRRASEDFTAVLNEDAMPKHRGD